MRVNATGRGVQRVVTDSEGKRLAWTAKTGVGKIRGSSMFSRGGT